MQQFVVPQFIDVEDKIIGPITVRQFLILLVAALLIAISYRFADIELFLILVVLIGTVAALFAFAKINGQNFHYFILNVVQTVKKPSQRLWQKGYTTAELKELLNMKLHPEEVEAVAALKPAKRQHIQQLSLVVNTGGYYRGNEELGIEEDL